MRLIIGNKDISELVPSITWSGDTTQVSRTLSFSVVQSSTDFHLPKVNINRGDKVTLEIDKNVLIFYGIIFELERTTNASGDIISCTVFDLMYYINNSDISKIFDNTAEGIAKEICKELDIPIGYLAVTDIQVYMPCLSKSAYQGIMMAYTYASRQNSIKYIPLIKNANRFSVVEKGLPSGVVLTGNYNLTDASYKESMQGLVNKLLIVDDSGKIINTITDEDSMASYGTVQKILKQSSDVDSKAEAQKMLKTFERTASVSSLSDIRAVSGYSVYIEEPSTKLVGKFYIEGDTHTFENGKATMQLTLAFEKMMDEMEMDKNELGK